MIVAFLLCNITNKYAVLSVLAAEVIDRQLLISFQYPSYLPD